MPKAHENTRGAEFKGSAAIWAGLIAGVVFLVMEMILVTTLGGGSAWGPPRMMAAMVMGQEVLPGPENPPTFDMGIVLVGMMVHFMLSIVLAVALAAVLGAMRAGAGTAIAVGAGFGLLVYIVNFYGLTAVFPWFENARNWITIASHLVFGAVVGGSYVSLATR